MSRETKARKNNFNSLEKAVTNVITGKDLAYTNGKIIWNFSPFNPDSLASKRGGLVVYETMLTDDQVKASTHLRKYPIISGGWRIDPYSKDAIDIEIRDFSEFALNEIHGAINETFLSILTALEMGFSINEKLFKKTDTKDFGEKIIISKVKAKHPDSFDFDTDQYGNLENLLQNYSEKLPPEKFVIFPYDKRFENLYGRSILRPAYRPWFSKDITIKFWNIFNERFGSPTAVGSYPAKFKHLKDTIDTILDNISAKESITIPEEIKIAFLESAKASATNTFGDAISYFDSATSKAILVPSNLGFSPQGNVGSQAQATVQFQSFVNWIVTPDQILLADVITEQMIKPLVFVNYGANANSPTFVFEQLTGLQTEEIAGKWIDAVSGGVVENRHEDENKFRTLLSFPDKPEPEDGEEEPTQEEIPDTEDIPGDGEERLDIVDIETETLSAHKKFALDSKQRKIQSRANIREINKTRMKAEDEAKEALGDILKRQRDSLISTVRKMSNTGKLNQRAVEEIALPYQQEVRTAYREILGDAFIDGQQAALVIIPKNLTDGKSTFTSKTSLVISVRNTASKISNMTRNDSPFPSSKYPETQFEKDFSTLEKCLKGVYKQFKIQVADFTPTQALRHFEQKAFWVSGVQERQILDKVKASLSKHIKSGVPIQETMLEIEDIFNQYIEQPDIKEELTSGHRLETIIRTNTTEAFSMGMVNTYRQPDVKRFIPGVQYSAVLDTRTTEVCNFLHGKQLKNTDPEVDRLTPANHFNCRAMWLPIFIGEPVEPMVKGEIDQAKDLVGKGFY
jgi:SPP1 gp7 family putative phage head morphogenesis protein